MAETVVQGFGASGRKWLRVLPAAPEHGEDGPPREAMDGWALVRALPRFARGEGPLHDAQGRRMTYLRLSITDHCNFRCVYCSPADWGGKAELLSEDEIARLAAVFAGLGITRVRLTGGEPTVRKDLVALAARVRATPGIGEVCLSTNGLLLDRLARPLFEAGVSRLNISLDALDDAAFLALSGGHGDAAGVLRGIEAALDAGFESVKTNTVVVAGVNDSGAQLAALVRWCWARGVTPRFIELMPFTDAGQPVPTREVVRRIEEQGLALVREADMDAGAGPATYYRGTGGRVGFIGSLTENFCSRCNRVRVAANGDLRACLGGRDRVALRGMLREGATDAEIEGAIRAALRLKPDGHRFNEPGAGAQLLSMMGIGG
jgi:cyclic pyranopterin phosphate synthase